jgi:hypothetical protein
MLVAVTFVGGKRFGFVQGQYSKRRGGEKFYVHFCVFSSAVRKVVRPYLLLHWIQKKAETSRTPV